MVLRKFEIAVCSALLGAALCAPVAVGAAETEEARVEMVLVQENGQTTAMSVSLAQGANVETASFISDRAISTGAIASDGPVGKIETQDGFVLFTSRVGQ